MKDKIEIERAENGYTVRVWKEEDAKESEYGYAEPTTHVATSDEELVKIVKENL